MEELNLFPSSPWFITHDPRDSHDRYTKFFGKRTPCPIMMGMALTNLCYLLKRQLAVGIAATVKTPAFGSHITGVFGPGADKHVIGSHTGRVVALMAKTLALWYRAIDQLPSKSMGFHHATGLSRTPELPVALQGTCCPDPAVPQLRRLGWYGAALIHLRPKPRSNIGGGMVARAETPRASARTNSLNRITTSAGTQCHNSPPFYLLSILYQMRATMARLYTCKPIEGFQRKHEDS